MRTNQSGHAARWSRIISGIASGALLGVALVGIGGHNAVAADATDLVTNGGFEKGLDGWKSGKFFQESASTIEIVSDDVHSGSAAVKVSNRKATDAGIVQSLAGKFVKGEEYTATMWIKSTEDATFNMTVCAGDFSGCGQLASAAVSAGTWTKITGSAALQVNDEKPSLVIETVYNSGKTADFLVDDVSIMGTPPQPVVRPVGKAQAAKQIGKSNPIIDYWYGADPWAMEYNGRVYVYTTGDATKINPDGSLTYDYEYDAKGNIKDNSFADVKTINVLSTDDMVNWRNEGYIRVAGPQGVAPWANNSWAPAVAHKTINGAEKFFLYFANGGSGVGVLTSDSPVGPWSDPKGELLIKWGTQASEGVVWLFDPAVLVDDDGTGYLYYGGGVPEGKKEHPNTARVIKLGEDMISTVGEAQPIDSPAMFEDSGIAKIGDTYYYTYCTNFSHEKTIDSHDIGYGTIGYMTSKSPMGPFTYQGEIMQNPAKYFGVGGNNHHAMVKLGDSWYMAYHAQTVAKALTDGGNLDKPRGYRNTHLDPITINADGTIADIVMTYDGLPQVKNMDPYVDGGIPASTIAWDSGIRDVYQLSSGVRVVDITPDNSKGQKLTNINNGEWTALSQVDFGQPGAAQITISAAGKAGGKVEVRLDSLDSAPVATVNIPAGDGSTPADYHAPMTATGVHNVFFSFVGGAERAAAPEAAELFDLYSYRFAKGAAVDTTQLQAEVDKSQTLNSADYTEGSWKQYMAAIDAARDVLRRAAENNATQADMDAALAAVRAVVLEPKPADPGDKPVVQPDKPGGTPTHPGTPTPQPEGTVIASSHSGASLSHTGAAVSVIGLVAVALLMGGVCMTVARRRF
ncbi:family 43 glycosylhydrolase [Trueperella sp. LYQ141]|uniref:family 43 glycosylhydrolase n=1 Tax=Trueperella sp. LYQ141 TaxID=3391058 RepID=UPI0039831A01